jgi:hypothetical protein
MVQVIKIGLVLAVAVIVYFVCSREENKQPNDEPAEKKFVSVEAIKKTIDSLDGLSDTTFEYRKEFYTRVDHLIKIFYRDGHLDKTQSDTLTKTLYNTYVNQFTEQVDAVFRGPDWKDDDLKFIRGECDSLRQRQSKLLKVSDSVDKKFDKFQNIIDTCDKIKHFITTCKSAECPLSDLEVNEKRSQAKKYQEGQYLPFKLCTRLKNELEKIPQVLTMKQNRCLNEEIVKEYLKGDELNIDTLKNYEKMDINDNLKKSIRICLVFWDLKGESYGKTYDGFRIKNDNVLNNSVLVGSKLKKYLDCGDSFPLYTTEYKKRMLKRESCD